MMSGISTVAGSEAMNAIHARQSGTASALMGTLMFVFGGIAAPLAGLGGETMLKMSFAMTLCYLAALLIGLKSRAPSHNLLRGNKIFQLYYPYFSRQYCNLLLFLQHQS